MDKKFKTFNEKFFSNCGKNVRWFDRQGLFKMKSSRVVTITLDDVGVSGNYNGYWVEITSTFYGVIAKKFFRFNEFLNFNDENVIYPMRHVVNRKDALVWYGEEPTDTKPMCDEIFEWIDSFIG